MSSRCAHTTIDFRYDPAPSAPLSPPPPLPSSPDSVPPALAAVRVPSSPGEEEGEAAMADLFESSGPRQLSRKTSEGLARALTGDFLSSSPPRAHARLSPSMRTSMSRHATTPRALRSLHSGGSIVSNESFVSALTKESMDRALGAHMVNEARCVTCCMMFACHCVLFQVGSCPGCKQAKNPTREIRHESTTQLIAVTLLQQWLHIASVNIGQGIVV